MTNRNKRARSRLLTNKGMIVKPGLLERYAIKNTPQGGSQQVPEDTFTGTYGEYGLVPPPYNPNALITLTEVNTYHARCCKQEALDVGGGGYSIQATEEGKGSKVNRQRLKTFFDSLPIDLWKRCHQDFKELGYAFVELVRYNDNPDAEYKEAIHLPAHTMRVHKSRTKFLQQRGGLKNWFKLAGTEGEINRETGEALSPESLGERANEVIYLTNPTARSDYYGFPDYIPAIPAMYGDQASAEYNVSFFQNYGIPTYAITITGDFEEGDRDETTGLTALEEALQEQLQTIQSNPHSTMVISIPSRDGLSTESKVNVEFKQLSVETKEASFRMYRMDNRDEVITAHGMDPYRIGVMVEGSLGGNTAIQSRKNYNNGTVQPRQQLWEDKINQVIVRDGFGVTDYVFKFNPIDLDDETDDLSLLKELFQMAAVTPAQLIGIFGDRWGLEEANHPALDAHYLNGVPLDYTPEAPVDEVVGQLEGLKERLLEVASKYADDTRNDPSRGLYNRITKRITNS